MGFVSFFLFFFLSLTTALFGSGPAFEMEYYVDTKGTLTLEEVQTLKRQGSRFHTIDIHKANFGYQEDVYWLTTTISNPTTRNKKLILELPYPGIDHLQVYVLKKEEVAEEIIMGDRVPFASRPIDYAGFAIPLLIPASDDIELFIRVETSGTMALSMELKEPALFFSKANTMSLILGLYFGAVLIMLVYNLILFVYLKDISYFNYVAFHFFLFILQFSLNGLGYQYLWPNFPDVNRFIIPLTMNLAGIFVITFFMSFLRTRLVVPRIHNYLKYYLQIQIALLITALFIPFRMEAVILSYIALTTILLLLGIAIYIFMRTRSKEAKFYLVAWGMFLGGSLLTVLQNNGYIPSTPVTIYASQAGVLMELSLLSIGLAYRYKEMHGKLLKKDAQLRQLNTSLEEKVHERTKDVYEKNRQLAREVANKKTLLRELYHRVKNNLQVIASLLSLQASRIDDPHYKEIFRQNQQRIKSMFLLHEHLYQSGSLDVIDMENYVQTLVQEIQGSYSAEHITFDVTCSDVELDLERAILSGLIINELVTNAVKYAFKGINDPRITLRLFQEGTKIILEIRDNGIGMESDSVAGEKSLGKKIVNTLVTLQLKGEIFQKNENGVAYRIEFNKENLL